MVGKWGQSLTYHWHFWHNVDRAGIFKSLFMQKIVYIMSTFQPHNIVVVLNQLVYALNSLIVSTTNYMFWSLSTLIINRHMVGVKICPNQDISI